jgi:hypothetical protein
MGFIVQDSGGGSTIDTVQNVNSATSTTATAWGSVIPCIFTAASQTITLPTIAVTDIGKSVTLQNAGTFPFTVAIASGSITSAVGLIVSVGSSIQIKAVSVTSAIVVSTNASQIVGLAAGVINLTASVPFAPGNNTAATAVTVFTIPLTVGSWDVSPHVVGNFSAFVVNSSASILLGLFDTAGVLVPGSETNISRVQSGNAGTSVAANIAGTGLIPVTVTTPGNYTIRAWNNGASSGGSIDGVAANSAILGQSRVSYKQTVGALPVSTSISAPQGYAHISIRNPTANSAPLAITSALAVGSTYNAGNLATAGGNNGITLKAGKTYYLEAAMSVLNYGGATANFPAAAFDICTGFSTTVIPGCSPGQATMGNLQSVPSIGSGAGSPGARPAYCYYTPTVDTVVSLTVRSFGVVNGAAITAVLIVGELIATEVGMQAQVVQGLPVPKSVLQLDNTGATAQANTVAAAGTTVGVLWNTSLFQRGTKATFTANSGSITLQGGLYGTTFRCTGKLAATGTTGNAYSFYRFYNVTTASLFGSEAYSTDPDSGTGSGSGWDEIPSPTCYGYVTVPAGATVVVRLAVTAAAGGGNIRQLNGQTSVIIEEID